MVIDWINYGLGNVDFLRVLWTDANIATFFQQYHPQHYEWFKSMNMNIKRADIARYFILYTFGGVYLDLDMYLRTSLTEVIIIFMYLFYHLFFEN